jgi:putative ABC transport system permease protein
MFWRLRAWMRALLRRDAVDREMHDELRDHIDRATERLVARGLSLDDARAEAHREFGNLTRVQEDARDARGVRWIEEIVQDVRYAVRGLRLKPGFACGVIVTLALGIGGNVTMFGIVDRLLFRPPAYLLGAERSHHLYLARMVDGRELIGQAAQYQRFLDLSQSAASTMDVVAAYAPRRLAVGPNDDERELLIGYATASLWKLFDAQPAMGRFFTADEDRDPGGARVAVLSYSYWQAEYGGSTDVLGKTIVSWPNHYTIIGVAPKGFGGVEVETPAAFIPMAVGALDDLGPDWLVERAAYAWTWIEIYGRRKLGVTQERAEHDLTALYRDSWQKQRAQMPATAPLEIANPRIVLGSMLAQRGPSPSAESRVATWLLGVTAIVMLVACANVGNLLLARALSRSREIAVRLALGVGRARLIRYVLIESFVLAILGAGVGLVVAQWGGKFFGALLFPSAEFQGVLTDPRVLSFAAFSALVCAIAAGLPPVFQANRSDVVTILKQGGRGNGRAGSRLRGTLMLAQASLSVVLLVGAGLFLRSMDQLSHVRLGYDADRLLAVQLRMRSAALDSAGQVALRRALIARAHLNPLIEGVSLVYSIPFAGTRSGRIFVDGIDSVARVGDILEQAGSPGYFETTGTRILRGRGIGADDRAGSPLVAVVSDGLARALWPGQDPIGRCIRRRSRTAPCRIIVGVAEGIKHDGLGDDQGLTYYLPAVQTGEFEGQLLVRVTGLATLHTEAVRRDLQREMPPASYVVVRPMSRILSNVMRSWRLGATMFTAFGVLALLLAAIGLYSVVAFAVAQRTHEVGVRMALGARAGDVVRLVVRDGLRVVLIGMAIGIGVATSGAFLLAPLLFRVSPRDPLVLASAAAVLVLAGIAASAIPAFRASRLDPARALRAE